MCRAWLECAGNQYPPTREVGLVNIPVGHVEISTATKHDVNFGAAHQPSDTGGGIVSRGPNTVGKNGEIFRLLRIAWVLFTTNKWDQTWSVKKKGNIRILVGV